MHPTEQLTRESSRPPVSTPTVLAKSGVCIAVIAGLAWIAVSAGGNEATRDASVKERATEPHIAVTGDRAAAHRRQVFEERRARFEASTPPVMAENALAHPYP
ncbi:MAG: hypothetical protein ABIQ06_15760 [Caldimonas sp.]